VSAPKDTERTERTERDEPWLDANGRPMRRLELHVTYTCPERCLFCSEEHRMQAYRRFPVTWGRVARVLREQASRGVTNVHFTGGEPTIHKRFVQILALSKKLGMRTSVGTIGTMLSRPEFSQQALPLLDEALYSLHGPDAETHDAMAGRAGSFAQVTRAIAMGAAYARANTPPGRRDVHGVFVNTVITRRNVEKLPQTAALADSLGAKLIVVSNLTPEGSGLDTYADLAVSLEDLARILPTVPAAAPNATLRFFGTPMCSLGDQWALSNDLHWDPRVTVEWQTRPGVVAFDGIYSWAPNRKRVHADACQRCSRRTLCAGVFYRYPELWPVDALKPFDEGESA